MVKLNNLLLFSLYYSSTDPVTAFLGFVFVILIGIYCCSSVTGDDQSSKSNSNSHKSNSYNSNGGYVPRAYDSNWSNTSNSIYYDEEINYNWDDSWDDKWLHQGEYADVVDTPSEVYTDYDPSWDEGWRD